MLGLLVILILSYIVVYFRRRHGNREGFTDCTQMFWGETLPCDQIAPDMRAGNCLLPACGVTLPYNPNDPVYPDDVASRENKMWIQFKGKRDGNATYRARFRVGKGHTIQNSFTRNLNLDNMYDTIQLAGTAEKAYVCEHRWHMINGDWDTSSRCQTITDKTTNGVRFEKGHKISSSKVFGPGNNDDDPNAYVILKGRKDDDQRPNELHVFFAEMLDWDNEIEEITLNGRMTVTLYGKENYDEDEEDEYLNQLGTRLVLDTKNQNNQNTWDLSQYEFEQEGQGKSGNTRTRTWDNRASSLKINYEETQLEIEPTVPVADVEETTQQSFPFIDFFRDDESNSKMRFKPTELRNLNIDNTYNSITMKGGARKVIVCEKNWDEYSDNDHETNDNKIHEDLTGSQSAIPIFDGDFAEFSTYLRAGERPNAYVH